MENKIEDSKYWQDRPNDDQRKDWRTGGGWIEEYVQSTTHPHRNLIVDVVGKCEPFETVFEIGCNAGPNILKIRDKFNLKDSNLYGIDLNKDSIDRAKEWMPAVNWEVGSVLDLPYESKSMNLVLLDACLMYVDDKEIGRAMSEIDRVAKRSIVICDWNGDTKEGEIKEGYHWGRDYENILKDLGFEVKKIQLTKETWPNERWIRNGYVWYAVRVSQTLEKN
jgi:SAM-dependent methyltransferase